jgi:methionyl-tRNA synthetase
MKPYFDAMNNLQFDQALDNVWLTVRSLNKYIEMVKPWEIAKKRETEPDAEAHLAEVLGHAVGTLIQIGHQLAPFLPGTSDVIAKTFSSGVVVPLEAAGGLFPKIYQYSEDPRTAAVNPNKSA